MNRTSPEVLTAVPQRAMAIGAHPDDVELYAGGTLARWIGLGCEVTVVVCTDGGAGTQTPNTSRGETAELRRREQERAAKQLGVAQIVMLDNADGELEDTVEFRGQLVAAIRQYRPDIVLSHDPHPRGRFVHRDHRMTGQATLDAVFPFARDPLHYPEQIERGLTVHRVDRCMLWDADEPTAMVDVSDHLATKVAALREHASQLEGLSGDANLHQWLGQHCHPPSAARNISAAERFLVLKAPP